ncbi:hypothetical protein L5515_005325 [Caenorhabditis briggsae]|uniref:Uncharacterized protein n=1 Tax=Caenorhabditis briggsae TaxID=6238 RepID=A0AAE9EK03_CAEBR|nr:hypothetical protein L5515_005325 [Caenorhabditis briggsae]
MLAKVDHGEIKPDFIVSVQNRKGKQSEVIITNDRVVVLCSDLQIDTAEAVSWSECYQAEVDSEAYITVSLQHADRQELDKNDSFEDFVPLVHSKQTPTSSAKMDKNQQRTQIMSDSSFSDLSSCTPSPQSQSSQSSPKKSSTAPDDVLKELGLFMSPDNTPKKRQRHSSHEKDEYSSSKKRKYHDESGVDQVKVGIDGQDQYKATTVTIKPSDIRKAEMRGFVLRGFDQNIFDSVASVSARNMLHQTKTHSPIFVVASKETLQQMVVLEGTHRVLSLISRLEEPDQEDFDFEAVIYETSDDFAGIWDSCVELRVGQSAKADVCRFPRKMMHLVQTTYGREFAKSLARFSKKQQSDALAIILDEHLDSKTKENVQAALYNKDTNPLFVLYRKCFDEGLVAAEPRDTHVEKGPFLSYFMGPATSKYFSENMEQIFSTNKCHILVLKASIMDDEATVKACQNYIDKKVLEPQFREILNDIIHDDDDDEESARKKKKVKGGAPVSNFKSVNVENLEEVPEKSIVKFTEKVTKDQIRILKEKKCSLILIGASTASVDIGDLMQSLGGNVRMGVFVKTSFICIGPYRYLVIRSGHHFRRRPEPGSVL